MAKGSKQEPRKTVWRGISVKADTRPSSLQSHDSGRTSVSWEKPLSPPAQQQEFNITQPPSPPAAVAIATVITAATTVEHDTQTTTISPSNSTTVSSTKSSKSSKSSKHKKEKLANLGSLTKTYEPTTKKNKEGRLAGVGSLTKQNEPVDSRGQKELERKERKEKEKLERKERKEQEKLEKEHQKKEMKEKAKELKLLKEKEMKEKAKELKSLKEKEKKDRKSKTKSSLFSRSSSKSAPRIDTDVQSTPEDKRKSPVERRSFISFGRHSLASLTSRPSNASNMDIAAPTSPVDDEKHVPENGDEGDSRSSSSSSEEFVDFADSHMSFRSDSSSHPPNIPVEDQNQKQQPSLSASSPLISTADPVSPTTPSATLSSPLQPRPQHHHQQHQHYLSPKIAERLPNSSSHVNNSSDMADSGASSITSENSKSTSTPNNNSNSMFYILNSLQDAGRDIEDDDLLDDDMASKMEEEQKQHQQQHQQQQEQQQQHRHHNQRSSFSSDQGELQGEHFDKHIQALEISITRHISVSPPTSPPPTEPLPPLPLESRRPIRLSTDSYHSSHQQHYSPSLTGRLSNSSRLSHSSSVSNSSYDTVAQAESSIIPSSPDRHQQHYHTSSHHLSQSPTGSPYGIAAISEEELLGCSVSPPSPIPDQVDASAAPLSTEILQVSHEDRKIDGSSLKDIDNTTDSDGSDDIKELGSDNNDLDYLQEDTDSISFESTEIPDPFLFPVSDEGDHQHIGHTHQGQPSDSDTIANVSPVITESSALQPVLVLTTTEEVMARDEHQENTTQALSVKTDNGRDVLGEALKVKTTDNVAGKQVPVMQVNISHETPTSHHSTLVTPMSAVIEPTHIPSIIETGDSSHYNQEQVVTTEVVQEHASPILAAAAVTASKRSSMVSAKRKSWSPPPTSPVPLDHYGHSPLLTESPTPLSTMTSTPTLSSTEIAANVIHNTGSSDDMLDKQSIRPNQLGPRQQEETDKPIRQGMSYLFSNKFTKAMAIFKSKADCEPLYALGLGSMLFLKAMMTYNENDINEAMTSLTQAYNIANTQADLSEEKPSFDDAFYSQFSSLMASTQADDGKSYVKSFLPNGLLRAHVVKAESCLLMGILQLTQENMTGYLKCGLNLKKACVSYTVVWKEYQAMGDQISDYMDYDTASAIQFGIGTLHLLLSSLPEKVVNVFTGLTWKTDKAMGFTLLKEAMIGKGTRSTFASLVLLSYYSLLSSSVPSIYAQESIQPTIECLVEAQKSHPKSCFFLYYAARISRVARNVGLSTQSFTMATTSTRKAAWAEVAMKHTVAYEVGLNHAMQLDWDTSAAYFEQLCCARDWSPAFCQYFVGACHEMMGQRQEAIDSFDEVPVLSHQQHHRKSLLDNYVQVKVERFQYRDYRDLDSCLPGLEMLLLLNAFASMEDTHLLRCLAMVQETIRLMKQEDVHSDLEEESDGDSNGNGSNNSSGSDDDDNDSDGTTLVTRYATLLLLRAAVLNALSRHSEALPELKWILERKSKVAKEEWILPFVYWETGVTHWGIGNQKQSRELWQLALSCTKYDFEFRMASRVHLALEKCDELGILEPSRSNTLYGRKRL